MKSRVKSTSLPFLQNFNNFTYCNIFCISECRKSISEGPGCAKFQRFLGATPFDPLGTPSCFTHCYSLAAFFREAPQSVYFPIISMYYLNLASVVPVSSNSVHYLLYLFSVPRTLLHLRVLLHTVRFSHSDCLFFFRYIFCLNLVIL